MQLRGKNLLNKFKEIIEFNLDEGRQTWQVELATECGYADPDPNSPRIPKLVLDTFENELTLALSNESIKNPINNGESILNRLSEREILSILKFNLYSLKKYLQGKKFREELEKRVKKVMIMNMLLDI